jgi:hypothetical protein
MKLLIAMLIYALSLAPMIALANLVSKTVSVQIISRFEQVIRALQ